jgi:hypothetical protein
VKTTARWTCADCPATETSTDAAAIDKSAANHVRTTGHTTCTRDEPNTCGGSMTGWLSRLAHHVRGHRVAVRQSTAAPLPVWVCACGERWAA